MQSTANPTMPLPTKKIPLSEVPQFSKRDLAYINASPDLLPFYKYPVALDSFKQVIIDKANDETDRELLVSVLREQYASLSENKMVLTNIEALQEENCFTVTTAHQPVIFTGPLYYIYKILSTIKLAEVLQEAYPSQQFVPVFVSGAEDHDFEEVQQTTVFGKELLWENEESGPVGKMSTSSLKEVINQLEEILGKRPAAVQIIELIKKSYQQNKTYGKATVELVHELFKDFGLVVVDMSSVALKQAAIPLFKKELLSSPSVDLIEKTQEQLNEKGYKSQATAREINLFYLGDQYRERIIKEGDFYKINNKSLTFSQQELLAELDAHPERFSPNVVMRPLYQELILPNLAYIGGGGEIAYWLERKTQFEHFDINFPMLIRRSSAMIVGKTEQKKLNKLDLQVTDLFTETHLLIKNYVDHKTDYKLDLESEKKDLATIFRSVIAKAKKIDVSLEGAVKAEEARQLKSLEQMEARFMKAEKRNQEVTVDQIKNLQERLFPSNGLQERKINFLTFYLNAGDSFFEKMKEELNPLDKDFVIFFS
ncbi:MAG: bacillithiol biosynthesis cysteine-adding enzyme BshC [Crocinitomicaceae bacterium]